MDITLIICIVLYLFSSAAYIAYLFLQKDYLHKIGYGLMGVAFLAHVAIIGNNVFISGLMPVRNLHETLSMIAWMLAGVFLAFQYRFKLKILGVYAAPLITLLMIASFHVPKELVQSKTVFKDFWLIFHVITIFAGWACFALACGLGILYLVQEDAIKSKSRGFFFKRLPSLELLDSSGYASIITGFMMLTLGLASGFLYAKSVWGKFWSWDPKEVWAGITWLFYAALLHERLTVGWRGRKSAIMSIIGFIALLFTFLGVNLLLKGHHGEFTKW